MPTCQAGGMWGMGRVPGIPPPCQHIRQEVRCGGWAGFLEYHHHANMSGRRYVGDGQGSWSTITMPTCQAGGMWGMGRVLEYHHHANMSGRRYVGDGQGSWSTITMPTCQAGGMWGMGRVLEYHHHANMSGRRYVRDGQGSWSTITMPTCQAGGMWGMGRVPGVPSPAMPTCQAGGMWGVGRMGPGWVETLPPGGGGIILVGMGCIYPKGRDGDGGGGGGGGGEGGYYRDEWGWNGRSRLLVTRNLQCTICTFLLTHTNKSELNGTSKICWSDIDPDPDGIASEWQLKGCGDPLRYQNSRTSS